MQSLVKGEVARIDLSACQGEDVEHTIRLIKLTYRVLKCSSTQTRSHVPLDFTKTVLKTFQTSWVPDFNDVFHRLEQDVIVAADMKGIKPEWPSVTSVLNLAANSFRRLESTDPVHFICG